MIQLPDDWLKQQLAGFLRRGTIIKFPPDDLAVQKYDGQMKYAVVLNAVCPAPEILYVFTTSNPSFFDKHTQFEPALIRVPAGAYDCFPLDTIIPFRDIQSIPLTGLEHHYANGRLKICGQLDEGHMTRMDEIIRETLFIPPRVQPRILPPT
jgi:hypothetical protein